MLQRRFDALPQTRTTRLNTTYYVAGLITINKHYSREQKTELLEQLWRVAFADGKLDKYEEHLVRKLAELLHVPHTRFVATKHRAVKLSGG